MPFRDAWLVVGLLLVAVGFAIAEPVIAAVGFVVIVIGGIARYWSRHLWDRVELPSRLTERRTFAGEEVGLSVTLSNRKLLPLPWFEWRMAISGQFEMPDEHLAAAAAPGTSWIVRRGAMSWYEQQSWDFKLASNERGYFHVGPTKLRSADLLGIFPQSKEIETLHHVTVYPRVYPIADLGLPADRPFGERRGRNPIFEDPIRVAGLREYRPGDPLKRIDWKATARTGELQSRVYEPSSTQQLYLMLNIDTMEHPWEGYLKDELERLVSTTASIAVWAAGVKYSVGLLANGAFPDADRPIRLPPSRSRDQLSRILDALAVIQPLTLGDLAGAIEREGGRLPAGSTIVVIASLIPPRLAGMIARLAAEGNRVFVVATNEKAAESVPEGIPMRTVANAFAKEGTVA
ncbi:MAG: DUF58 domain-containing protein [Dehalococcoidia bacterium]